MAVEFGTGKTVLILATVVGCFAVLWPKLFYPMLQASFSQKPSFDSSQVCCDVIFETDVNAIKIVVEMCGNILHQYDDVDPRLVKAFEEGRLSKDVVRTCRNEVLSKCGVDITAFLEERVRLGHTYKQILDEIRSFNSSVCLKNNFGVPTGLLGAPRHMRMRVPKLPSHFRQERPPHIRPEMLHPALRERGRAIPQSHIVPRVTEKEGKPVPVPGIRPPMGGAGHVVPPPKGTGTMGIIMPIYTVGIVVFFMYTIMKVMFKKQSAGPGSYPEHSPDPQFRKLVFEDEAAINRGRSWKSADEPTKLVATAISGLLAEVDQQRDLLARREELDVQVQKEPPEAVDKHVGENEAEEGVQCQDASEDQVKEAVGLEDAESSAQVQVVNMELTASCEGGQRWSRPATPVPCLVPPPPPSPSPEPPAIFLEGALPSQSQLLVADSATEAVLSDDDDVPVILSGKMTLSLIGLDHDQNPELDQQEGSDARRMVDKVSSVEAGHQGRAAAEVDDLLAVTPTLGAVEEQAEAAVHEQTLIEEVGEVAASLPEGLQILCVEAEPAVHQHHKHVKQEEVEEEDVGEVAGGEKQVAVEEEKMEEKREVEEQVEVEKTEVEEQVEVEKKEVEERVEVEKKEVEEQVEVEEKEVEEQVEVEEKEVEVEKKEVEEQMEVEEKEMEVGMEELGMENVMKEEVEIGKEEEEIMESEEEEVEEVEEIMEEVESEEEEVEEVDEPVAMDAPRQQLEEATGVLSEEDSLQTAKETASEVVEYEDEDVEEDEDDDSTPPRLTNATNCADEAPSTTNYTTASAAAEATNATGPEETAADLSALESIDPDDDNDDLEEEVWNGDVDSEDESDEEDEAPQVPPSAQPSHRQHTR